MTIRSIIVSEKKSDNNKKEDSFGISSLTIAQLKQELSERGLAWSRNKTISYTRLFDYMQAHAFEDDNEQEEEDENNEQKEEDSDLFPRSII